MKHPRSRSTLFVLITLLVLVFTLTVAIAYAKPDKDAEKSIGEKLILSENPKAELIDILDRDFNLIIEAFDGQWGLARLS